MSHLSGDSNLLMVVVVFNSSKDEMYRHLSVDVGKDVENKPWTVECGLNQFFQPEKREIKCEKCADGTTATQTMRIISRWVQYSDTLFMSTASIFHPT